VTAAVFGRLGGAAKSFFVRQAGALDNKIDNGSVAFAV
jgi:hypothetical protein